MMKPTTIFAKWPGVADDDLILEANQLGRIDYIKTDKGYRHVFTRHYGWFVMEKMIAEGREDILNATKFISSSGKEYSIDALLDSFNKNGTEFKK